MKRYIRQLLCVVTLLCMLPTSALAASLAPGHAMYRELDTTLIADAGHAALINAVSGNSISTVIHMTASNGMEVISFSAYGQDEWGCPFEYWGEFYLGTGKPYTRAKNTAQSVLQEDPLYTAVNLLNLWDDPSLYSGTIQPDDIYSIRCDGLVEYCYEYCDIMIDSYNISDPTELDTHPIRTPRTQMNLMTPVQ